MGHKLVINADDYGRDRGTTIAVADCFSKGCVTSASLLATGKSFGMASRIAKKLKIPVGVHLTLCTERALFPMKPLSGTKSFSGGFANSIKDLSNFDHNDVFVELCSQVDRIISSGLRPWFMDSHMFCIPRSDGLFTKILDDLYRKYKIPFVNFRKGPLTSIVEKHAIEGGRSVGGSSIAGKRNKTRRAIIRASKRKSYWLHVHVSKSKHDYDLPRRWEYKIFMSRLVPTLARDFNVTLFPVKDK